MPLELGSIWKPNVLHLKDPKVSWYAQRSNASEIAIYLATMEDECNPDPSALL